VKDRAIGYIITVMETGKPKRKKLPLWIALAVIMAGSLGLMIKSPVKESAIVDEIAHIPAGYAYVVEHDYRLNPEHPPLVKIISAIPLAISGFNFPTNIPAWTEYVNGQWDMGANFLYHSENNADLIVQLARIGPMILTLLLIFTVYIWSKSIMGERWALLPAAIVALSPTFLAHGHYVTTDIGAALGVISATYFFVKCLEKPTRKNIIIAGIFFGIAQLLKFSLFLLVPYFMLLAAVYGTAKALRNGGEHKVKAFFGQTWIQLRNIAAVFIVGYLLIYPVYFLTTIKYPIERQVSDTRYILNSTAGGPDESACAKLTARCPSELTIRMAESRILRPYAEYTLGFLMVAQRASGGNTGYFMGEVSAAGWPAYFPVVYALKEPLPLLILALSGLIFAATRRLNKPLRTGFKRVIDYLGTNFSEFAMATFIIVYAVVSIRSPLNIGIRHLMPILPLIYILSTASLKNSNPKYNRWIAAGIIVWLGIETAFVSPNYISYFNEIGGGTKYGYERVVDSNYDWGQDLKRLASFVQENKIDKIAIDYFGEREGLKYYIGESAVEYWWSARGNPKDEGIKWLAISVNTLQLAKGNLNEGFVREPQNEYYWLDKPYEPYARAGNSIFIYKLAE
jgi:hypothetical protein